MPKRNQKYAELSIPTVIMLDPNANTKAASINETSPRKNASSSGDEIAFELKILKTCKKNAANIKQNEIIPINPVSDISSR